METFPSICEAFRNTHPGSVVMGEHIWTAHVSEALRRGTVDVVLASCPEFDPALSIRTIRRERVVALVSRDHPAADAPEVARSELASSEFLCPPADLTPRFHEVLIGVCQAAGFDPIISRHALVAGWEADLILDNASVTLVAESFIPGLADCIVAVPLTPLSYLDTTVI